MKDKYYIDNRYVSFASYDMIADVTHIRIKIRQNNTQESEAKQYIASLEFLRREMVGDNLITFDSQKARCTEILELKLLKYFNGNPDQERPDGSWWKEPNGESLTGDPDCHYYRIDEKLLELLNNALVHSSYIPEQKARILVLFFKEDLIKSKYSEEWMVLIPMTPEEIDKYNYEFYEAKRKVESFFHEYPPHEDDYPGDTREEDSWMDNEEDYWNID